MAPPARDKKRGVSETLDPKSRIQRSVINAGRAQPLAATLARSVEMKNAVVEQIAAARDAQVVALPSEQAPALATNIDDEHDQEIELDEFPPLGSTNLLKRTAEPLSQSDDTQNDICTQREDLPTHNSKLMMKARGLLNVVGLYLEEMESECPGAWSSFLALISDGVSRAVRGEEIFLKSECEPHSETPPPTRTNNTWASRVANGVKKSTILYEPPLQDLHLHKDKVTRTEEL